MMSFLDLMIAVARTWGHIAIGIGVMLLVLCGGWMIGRWYNGLLEQIDEMRRTGKLPTQPWKYQ